ncbi:tripartite tricarboxylate transporter TctB family protein [Roseitranquillus sediminis]|uniref:tripartite tricarboxylate transporter TctB family protein n=1 Tax=Roseitranquillus sediminis TaxID=2809051 RepID=UPI002223B0F1|nr:tripartite tricarboxylate transporter TctB family protein [Roseitranquillus sediminis]MBM9593485.1 tripartite tricarboxylate transporter TctB family protein [Roseitranquillus sediminis]
MTRSGLDLAVTLGLLVLYVLGIIHVGFFTASFVFMICQMALMGQRRPVVMVSVSIGLLAVLYGVVEVFLNVAMPSGLLF